MGIGNQKTAADTQQLIKKLEIRIIGLDRQNSDLYELAPLGYFTLDSGGIIRRANFAGAHLLGIDRSLLLTRQFGYFVSGEDRLAFEEFLKKVFRGRLKKRCNVKLGQEGYRRWHVRIEAKLNPDGQECWMAVLDMTKQKTAEEKLRKLQLEQRTERAVPPLPEEDTLSTGNHCFSQNAEGVEL